MLNMLTLRILGLIIEKYQQQYLVLDDDPESQTYLTDYYISSNPNERYLIYTQDLELGNFYEISLEEKYDITLMYANNFDDHLRKYGIMKVKEIFEIPIYTHLPKIYTEISINNEVLNYPKYPNGGDYPCFYDIESDPNGQIYPNIRKFQCELFSYDFCGEYIDNPCGKIKIYLDSFIDAKERKTKSAKKT